MVKGHIIGENALNLMHSMPGAFRRFISGSGQSETPAQRAPDMGILGNGTVFLRE